MASARAVISHFLYLLIPFFLFFNVLSAQDEELDRSEIESVIEEIKAARNLMARHKMDSLASFLLELEELQEFPDLLHLIYFHKCDALSRVNPAEGVTYCNKCMDYFEDQGDQFQLSRYYNVYANVNSNFGKFLIAAEFYAKAVTASEFYEKESGNDDEKFRSRSQYNAGFSLTRQGKLAQATRLFFNSLESAKQLNDSLLAYSTYHQLGNIELLRHRPEKALIQFKRSLEIVNVFNHPASAQSLIAVGSAHQEMYNIDSAMYYYDRASSMEYFKKDVYSRCVVLFNSAEIFLERGDHDKSIELSLELLDKSLETGLRQHAVNGYTNLVQNYKAKKDFATAKRYAQLGLELLEPELDFSIAVALYKHAADLYEQCGDYKQALKYEREHQIYSDSLSSAEVIATLDELNVAHESSIKDLRIAELEGQNRINELAFRQRLFIMGGVLLGVVLLSIIAYLWFNQRRIALEQQKENIEGRLLRSQMNPHFIFNAISSIQNYFFDKNDLKLGLSYMSKFAQLMRQILEHSREEYVTLEDEIESLTNYLEIQQLRYSNSFGYEIKIDEELETKDILVPPLIAQPFVENAIEHGMIYRIDNGSVKISFENKGDIILLSIEDNGVAGRQMTIKPKPTLKKGKSLSTKITKERLEHLSVLNRKRFELVTQTITTGGLLVSIELPKMTLR